MRLNDALHPDIVFLDVQMPGTGGIEAAKRMMSLRPVPIVICSAYCDDELVNSAAEAGVYAYVVKPCRSADLLPAMSTAVLRFGDTRQLMAEVDALKEALCARRWVEQAKGIMMKKRGLHEDEAHRFLQQESQRQSKPLPELAKAIVFAENAFSHSVQSDGAAVDGAT